MNIFQRNVKKIVVLAVIAGSCSSILARMITANAMAIGFYRLVFALPFFAVPLLLNHRDEFKKISAKEYLWSFLAGLFLFAHFFCWFTAVDNTTIASAAMLAGLHPLVVLIVTILIFKQKVNRKALIGIIIALLGASIIAGNDYSLSGIALYGDIMALFTAIFMGLYFCVGRVIREKIPSGVYVFLVFASCWVFFTVGMVATGTPFTGYPTTDYLWLIVMAFTCQIGAHAVFNWCMGYVSSLYVSAWETADAVFASVLAVIVLVEIPSIWQLLGGVIVIGGLLYYNYHDQSE